MYIVIAGAGLVGADLVKKLLANKHDVVVIDVNKERCDRIYSETGAVAIHGSAASLEVLREAELHKADVIVAATTNDADNLSCAILAKSIGVPEIIVRMRDPEYEKAYRVVGANSVIRVTDLMVDQMLMAIEKPKARKITSIGGGKADIFKVIVPPGAKVAGQEVKTITGKKDFPSQCVFIAVYNQEQESITIPRGNQIINENDHLFLISAAENIKQAVDVLIALKDK